MNKKLFGLVLAGGKSRRMGRDKGLMNWHGKEQRYYVADFLSKYCEKVYISCREDQKKEIEDAGYIALVDNFSGTAGPYGALVSAMRTHENVGWFVVACDLPFFDENSVHSLIENRDFDKIATVYQSPVDSLPEPLAGIWEPTSQKVLIDLFSEQDITCPRKALIKSSNRVRLVMPSNNEEVMNVNTAKEADEAGKIKIQNG